MFCFVFSYEVLLLHGREHTRVWLLPAGITRPVGFGTQAPRRFLHAFPSRVIQQNMQWIRLISWEKVRKLEVEIVLSGQSPYKRLSYGHMVIWSYGHMVKLGVTTAMGF